jgi:hypothetical protein
MDELKAFEALVRGARRETPPAFDVGGAVLAGIRAGYPPRLLPLSIMAAVTAVAAAVVLALAIHAVVSGSDPQTALFPMLEVSSL